MAARWDLAGNLLDGASLGARIAGQMDTRDIERKRLAQEKTAGDARAVETSGYTMDQLADPASGAAGVIQGRNAAASAGKLKLEGAQADYYSGRNAAYTAAASARAGAMAAKTGAQGMATLQAELKKYDDMAMVDPDGTKGIYTSDAATRHAALWNQFSTMQKIGGAPATPGNFNRTPEPGMWDRAMTGIGKAANYFGGGAAAPAAPAAAGPAYTKFSSGGGKRYGLNPQTNSWDLLPAAGQ